MSRFLLALSLLFAAAGCTWVAESRSPSPVRLHETTPENLIRITDWLYSGGEPRGPRDFDTLAALGIATVVSVDGLPPDAEAARSRGMRTVHIPVGYDGMDPNVQHALTRVARHARFPIYVHCHHGLHRGPAAAAVVGLARGAIDRDGARSILEFAGTSVDYPGLWGVVDTFVPPAPDALLPELTERREQNSGARIMAELDRAWSRLKLCRKARWTAPANHPDIVPHREALLVAEGFREFLRVTRAHGEVVAEDRRITGWLEEGYSRALELKQALESEDTGAAEARFDDLARSCQRCHRAYRDTADD